MRDEALSLSLSNLVGERVDASLSVRRRFSEPMYCERGHLTVLFFFILYSQAGLDGSFSLVANFVAPSTLSQHADSVIVETSPWPAANNAQKGAEVTVSENLVRNGVFVYIPSH